MFLFISTGNFRTRYCSFSLTVCPQEGTWQWGSKRLCDLQIFMANLKRCTHIIRSTGAKSRGLFIIDSHIMKNRFDVITIGGSAGSLLVLTDILDVVPHHLAAPVIIVLHRLRNV